jgi:hypothetical protein
MVTLTNVGTTYDAVAASKGLGMGLVDFTGAVSIIFWVKYNKVGTGTLSWQLWNETDGQEIGVITDADAAADNKSQESTFAINGTGTKRLRVRAKSSVGTDDPVFYGAAVSLVYA